MARERPSVILNDRWYEGKRNGWVRSVNDNTTNATHLIILAILTGAIFALDLWLPLGVAGGVPYVAVILLGWWLGDLRKILLLAALSSALILAGFFLSPPGGTPWMVFANRGLALFAIWVTAALLAKAKRAEARLRAAHDNLERRVKERTAELVHINENLQSEIDERKRAEVALRDSRARFRDFGDASSDWFWEMDADLRFSYFSDRFTEITGVPKEMLIGKTRQETPIPDVDPEAWETQLADLAARQQFRGFEVPRTHPDGRVIHVSIDGKPWFDEAGNFKGFRGAGRDITERKRSEEALRESQGQVHLLLDSMVEAIYGIDLDGNCTFCNRACIEMLGYDGADDLLGKNVHSLMHHTRPDGTPYPVKECLIYQAFVKGEGAHVDTEVLWRADGTSFNAEYWSHPIRRDDRCVGLVVTFVDITERKKVEAALKESQVRFKSFAEISADWLWEMDADLRFSYISDGYFKIFGTTPDTVLGKTRGEILGKRVTDAEPAKWQRHFEDLDAHRPVREFDFIQKVGDGRERHLVLNGLPLFDDNGDFKGYRGNTKDITDRKLAELALRENKQRLNVVMNSVVDAVMTYDADGFIRSFNRAAEGIFAIPMAQALEMKVSDLMPEEFFDDHDDFMAKLHLDKDSSYTGERPEVTGRRNDGTVFPLELSVSRTDFSGQAMLVAICRDITERKQVEAEQAALEEQLRQSQKMEAIGQLTGGIAHDFNNLLMVIDGYSRRAIKQMGEPDVARESLARVINATDKAAKLTQQLLVFSRRQVMQTRVVRVGKVLGEALDLLRRSVGERFELGLQVDDARACLEIDPGHLDQAIMNLVINARDAMPNGGEIVVGSRTMDLDAEFTARHNDMSPGRHVEISVSDQGTGMDPETLQHIFEPFFTTKEPGKGTGLGLSMVHGFAQQAHGAVEVSSVVGEGATFRIYLPLVEHEPQTELDQVGDEDLGRGETVLLVEDDVALLTLTEQTLVELGYTVLKAEDGLAALEVEGEAGAAIDLLITDVVMPNLGGFELANFMRETRPDMKIMFMSGYPTRGDMKEQKIPKHATFLQKPVKPHVLARTIRTVLDSDELRSVV